MSFAATRDFRLPYLPQMLTSRNENHQCQRRGGLWLASIYATPRLLEGRQTRDYSFLIQAHFTKDRGQQPTGWTQFRVSHPHGKESVQIFRERNWIWNHTNASSSSELYKRVIYNVKRETSVFHVKRESNLRGVNNVWSEEYRVRRRAKLRCLPRLTQ